MIGGHSIVFTRKTVVGATFIRNSGKICKTIVGNDAHQIYLFSACQPMPTGLYLRWDFDTESNRFKPQQNKSETLRYWLCHISKDKDLTVKLRASTSEELRKSLIVSRQMVFAHTVRLCWRLGAASSITVHVRGTTISN